MSLPTSSSSSGPGGWSTNPSPPMWFRDDVISSTSSHSSSSSSVFSSSSTSLELQLQHYSDLIHQLFKDLSLLSSLSSQLGKAQYDNSKHRRKVSVLREKLRNDLKQHTSDLRIFRSQLKSSSSSSSLHKTYTRLFSSLQSCAESFQKLCTSIDVTLRSYPTPPTPPARHPSSYSSSNYNETQKQQQQQLLLLEQEEVEQKRSKRSNNPVADLEGLKQKVLEKRPSSLSSYDNNLDFETQLVMDTQQAMTEVNQKVGELKEAYTDVCYLLQQQGETVDNIDQEVAKAERYVDQSVVNLVEGSKVKKSGYVMKGVAGGAVIGSIALGGGLIPIGVGLGAVLGGAALGGVLGGVCGGVGGNKVANVHQHGVNKIVIDEMIKRNMGEKWYQGEDAPSCFECERDFLPVIRKKHRCRGCGEMFCAPCSNFRRKVKVPGTSSKLEARVCSRCDLLNETPLGTWTSKKTDAVPVPPPSSSSPSSSSSTSLTSRSRSSISFNPSLASPETTPSFISSLTPSFMSTQEAEEPSFFKRIEEGFRTLVDTKSS